MRIGRLIISFLVLAVSTSAVRAECLWDDRADLDKRFKAFVAASVSASCKPLKTGYMTLLVQEPRTLKFEMVVRMSKSCFAKTSKALGKLQKQGKLIACRGNRATAVESYPNADGGPTFMIVFRASKAEMREAGRYGK